MATQQLAVETETGILLCVIIMEIFRKVERTETATHHGVAATAIHRIAARIIPAIPHAEEAKELLAHGVKKTRLATQYAINKHYGFDSERTRTTSW